MENDDKYQNYNFRWLHAVLFVAIKMMISIIWVGREGEGQRVMIEIIISENDDNDGHCHKIKRIKMHLNCVWQQGIQPPCGLVQKVCGLLWWILNLQCIPQALQSCKL